MNNDLYIGWDELLHYDTKLKEYLEDKLSNAAVSEETLQRIVQELLSKYVTIEDAHTVKEALEAADAELVAQIDNILSAISDLDARKVDEGEFETFQTSISASVEKLETDLTTELENTFESVSLDISDLKDATDAEFAKLKKVVTDNAVAVNERLDLVDESIAAAQATAIQDATEQAAMQDAVVLAEAQEYAKDLVNNLPAQVDYTVTITESQGVEDAGKTYVFSQNNREIGTIKLAKDLVVTSGSVKVVVQDDQPYIGAKVGDKYIELIIANQSSPLYIPAKDLVDVYTAKDNATEVQVAISNTNEISATLVNGSVTEEKLATAVKDKLNKIWEEVGVAQDLVDGLANGQVTANKDGIKAINDKLLTDYATKEEMANQDAVVLAEAQRYADAAVANIPAQIDYTVTITENVDDTSTQYVFTQNATTIGTISIPKESVVTSGSIKTVITDNDPYDGAVAGDKYIDLEIANQTEHLYIPAKDLVDIYTAKAGAAEVQVVIDTDNVISASLVDEGVTEEKLAAGVQNKLNKRWAEIATTLAGYGILDAYTKTETSNQDAVVLAEAQQYADAQDTATRDDLIVLINEKQPAGSYAPAQHTHSESEITGLEDKIVQTRVNEAVKASQDDNGDSISETYAKKAATLEGYGITDAYTKIETSNQDAVVLAEAQRYTDAAVATIPYAVTVTEDTSDSNVAKTYIFTQNDTQIGTIKLAKEHIITSGTVKEVTATDIPYNGAAVGDKYIELVISNQDTPVYVPVTSLVDTYSAQTNAQEIQLAINSDNEISATIVDGSITEQKLAEAVKNKWEEVGVAQRLVDALANGQVKTNTEAIAAIKDPDKGILKQANEYVDNRLVNYITKDEAANQDVVVLSESQLYTDAAVIEATSELSQQIESSDAKVKTELKTAIDAKIELVHVDLYDQDILRQESGETEEARNVTSRMRKLMCPEKTSDILINDAKYQTETQLNEAVGPVAAGVRENTDKIKSIEASIKTLSEALANVTRLKLQRVDKLEDIVEEGVIYLVLTEATAETNVYDEYIIVGHDEAGNTLVEKIGSTQVDLTDYVTTEVLGEQLTKALENYVTKQEYQEHLVDIQAQLTELNESHKNFVDITKFNTHVENSANAAAEFERQLASKQPVGDYVTQDTFNETVQDVTDLAAGLSQLKNIVDISDSTVTEYIQEAIQQSERHAPIQLYPHELTLPEDPTRTIKAVTSSPDGQKILVIYTVTADNLTSRGYYSNNGGISWQDIQLPAERNWNQARYFVSDLNEPIFNVWCSGTLVESETGDIVEQLDGIMISTRDECATWEILSDSDSRYLGIKDFDMHAIRAGYIYETYAAVYADGHACSWTNSASVEPRTFTDRKYVSVSVSGSHHVIVAEDGLCQIIQYYEDMVIFEDCVMLPYDHVTQVTYAPNTGFIILSRYEAESRVIKLVIGHEDEPSTYKILADKSITDGLSVFKSGCLFYANNAQLSVFYDGIREYRDLALPTTGITCVGAICYDADYLYTTDSAHILTLENEFNRLKSNVLYEHNILLQYSNVAEAISSAVGDGRFIATMTVINNDPNSYGFIHNQRTEDENFTTETLRPKDAWQLLRLYRALQLTTRSDEIKPRMASGTSVYVHEASGKTYVAKGINTSINSTYMNFTNDGTKGWHRVLRVKSTSTTEVIPGAAINNIDMFELNIPCGSVTWDAVDRQQEISLWKDYDTFVANEYEQNDVNGNSKASYFCSHRLLCVDTVRKISIDS